MGENHKRVDRLEVDTRPEHRCVDETGGHDEQWREHECVRIPPGREPNAEVRPEPLADAPVRGEQGDECPGKRAEPTDPDERSRGRRRNQVQQEERPESLRERQGSHDEDRERPQGDAVRYRRITFPRVRVPFVCEGSLSHVGKDANEAKTITTEFYWPRKTRVSP